MSATESGQPLSQRIPHPQTAPAVELHALRLGDGEQRVRHESVIAEHGVIEPAIHPDSVEPRTKTVGDVLRHAARIIEERGWWSATNAETLHGRPVCALIAIGDAAPRGSALENLADEAMQRWLSVDDVMDVARWNDAPGRTAAEVIAAFRAAADEADR